MKRYACFAVAVLGACCSIAPAQVVLYVAPCGNDSNAGFMPDCSAGGLGPLRTIQVAMNRIAASGLEGIAVVTPGVWNERLTVPGGNVTIQSRVEGSGVFLSPTGAGTVLARTAGPGQTLTLRNVIVVGGNANGSGELGNGGGIRVTGGNLTMRSSGVNACSAVGEGGGVWFSGGVLTLDSCVISGNSAGSGNSGGGVFARFIDHATLEHSTFVQNGGGGAGGAHLTLYESGSANTVEGCEFRAAPGSSPSSAVSLQNNETDFVDCTFVENNNAAFCLALLDATVRIRGGAFRFNNGSDCVGLHFTTLTCEGVSFIGNGGFAVYGLFGVNVGFDRCVFDGAGITNVFVGYVAGTGRATNSVFSGGNYGVATHGFTIDRCTLVGQAVAPVSGFDSSTITNSIVWGQAGGPHGSQDFTVGSCIIDHAGQWPAGDRVFTTDPLLDAEFRPRAGSWAIDAANPALLLGDHADADGDGIVNEPAPYDLDGNPRTLDDVGLPDQIGSASDLGAFEFQGTTCRADFDGDGFVTGADYDLFVQAFEAGDAYGDFDRDGFPTGLDFDGFVQLFEGGC